MARKPMVTRTMTITNATVLCADIESAECFNEDITISREFKNEAELLKAIKKSHETETKKILTVVHTSIDKKILGMPEDEFIQHAVEITR